MLSMNRYSLQANVEVSRTRGLVSGNGAIGDYYTGTTECLYDETRPLRIGKELEHHAEA